MLYKFILFFPFIILLGCAKDENVQLSNSVDIFKPKDTISFVYKEERENSQLENLINLKEYLNKLMPQIKTSQKNTKRNED